MRLLRCCVYIFLTLFVVISFVTLLPLILNWPTRAERQIMNEVEHLGGRAFFPHTASACGYVDLRHSKVTDRNLALLDLGQTRHFWTLYLSDTHIGDPGMKYVAQLSSLRTLYLDDTRVTDSGISELISLRHLENLNLSNTHVTDASLPYIGHMKSLDSLNIKNTRMTDSAAEKLAVALPHLSVFRGDVLVCESGVVRRLSTPENPKNGEAKRTK